MKNKQFHFRLRKLRRADGRPWTVGRMAAAIGANRAHLTDVLNNTPGHGGQTRPKVLRWMEKEFPPATVAALTQALGWAVPAVPAVPATPGVPQGTECSTSDK